LRSVRQIVLDMEIVHRRRKRQASASATRDGRRRIVLYQNVRTTASDMASAWTWVCANVMRDIEVWIVRTLSVRMSAVGTVSVCNRTDNVSVTLDGLQSIVPSSNVRTIVLVMEHVTFTREGVIVLIRLSRRIVLRRCVRANVPNTGRAIQKQESVRVMCIGEERIAVLLCVPITAVIMEDATCKPNVNVRIPSRERIVRLQCAQTTAHHMGCAMKLECVFASAPSQESIVLTPCVL